jgi:TPR repeat protein
VRETVAEYLATNPTPDAMLAKGKEFAQAGEANASFLVWRRAAEAGSVPAQVELATFYDPLETPSRAGFTPDGARAADWYERAALAGNAEAQRKFGLLLAKGGAGLPADAGRAKAWLQQAADQNDAAAKKALESLPK